MRADLYTKIVLTAIALLLGILCFRPLMYPRSVDAQTEIPQLYIEPGYTMLRAPDGSSQLQGKMVVDLRTGDIWGFPTLVSGPYPIDISKPKPPVSKPMYLGKFDFAALAARP